MRSTLISGVSISSIKSGWRHGQHNIWVSVGLIVLLLRIFHFLNFQRTLQDASHLSLIHIMSPRLSPCAICSKQPTVKDYIGRIAHPYNEKSGVAIFPP